MGSVTLVTKQHKHGATLGQPLSHKHKRICCDITDIWILNWLTHPTPLSTLSPSTLANPHDSPSCLSIFPPPLPEMKGKNPWNTPATIIITVIAVIAIVALVTVAVLQNRPLQQKYKVR